MPEGVSDLFPNPKTEYAEYIKQIFWNHEDSEVIQVQHNYERCFKTQPYRCSSNKLWPVWFIKADVKEFLRPGRDISKIRMEWNIDTEIYCDTLLIHLRQISIFVLKLAGAINSCFWFAENKLAGYTPIFSTDIKWLLHFPNLRRVWHDKQHIAKVCLFEATILLYSTRRIRTAVCCIPWSNITTLLGVKHSTAACLCVVVPPFTNVICKDVCFWTRK